MISSPRELGELYVDFAKCLYGNGRVFPVDCQRGLNHLVQYRAKGLGLYRPMDAITL